MKKNFFGDNKEVFHYNGKCKALNKLTGKIIGLWMLALLIMALLGSLRK